MIHPAGGPLVRSQARPVPQGVTPLVETTRIAEFRWMRKRRGARGRPADRRVRSRGRSKAAPLCLRASREVHDQDDQEDDHEDADQAVATYRSDQLELLAVGYSHSDAPERKT